MFGVLDAAKVAVGFILGGLIGFASGQIVGDYQGRQSVKLEQAQAAATAEKERGADDAQIRGLSDYELCARSLRARRMPIDACEPLRGIPAGEP